MPRLHQDPPGGAQVKWAGAIGGGLLIIFLAIGPFRQPMMNGIKGLRTVDTTQSFVVVTGGGITAGNVTLSRDLFQANIANIDSIASTYSETPAASGYDEDTRVLLLAGLAEGQSRTLTIQYSAETDDDTMRAIGPFLLFVVFGLILFIVIYSMAKHGHRNRG